MRVVTSVPVVASWHSVQEFVPLIAVPHVYGASRAPRSARCCGTRFVPHEPNVPPLTATTAFAAAPYVKVTAPPLTLKFTVPFACVAAVARPCRGSRRTARRRPSSSSGAAPCELVTSVPVVALWHSVQEFVPLIAVPQV